VQYIGPGGPAGKGTNVPAGAGRCEIIWGGIAGGGVRGGGGIIWGGGEFGGSGGGLGSGDEGYSGGGGLNASG